MATQKLPSSEQEMPSGKPGRASMRVSTWPACQQRGEVRPAVAGDEHGRGGIMQNNWD